MAREQNFAAGGISIIFMLLPLLYFGGLIYYFSGVGGGTLQGIADIGLGPTVLGLAFIGLLFAIKPVMMLIRLLATMGSTRPQPTAARGTSGSSDEDGLAGSFDADDAIARYMARRNAAPMEEAAASRDQAEGAAISVARPSFGRKPV
jgi:predicted lipid-binding transport protein (Tim44 family)